MKKSKYIIFDVGGLEIPVVFCPLIQHESIQLNGGTPIAAGFCELDPYESYWSEVYGESFSLKLKSREEKDRIILNKFVQCEPF